ncbi:MAG: hypothetical protein ACRDOK_00775 [Streptosporangiaceae bacterium]
MRNPVRLTGAVASRKTIVTVAGAAAALAGIGTASAATVASTSHAPASHVVHATSRTDAASQTHVVTTAATAPRSQARRAAPAAPQPQTWQQIQQTVAQQTNPGEPAQANQLQPVGTSGPQASMPLSGQQMGNATTIVQQALAKRMGVRSAVIAVATSMQESQLQNVNYGTSDSLGLFQQRPSCGWGTAQQILDPAYSAGAFLTALQQHQASDPGWATQPLWANAQAVQNSGYPLAYAKWESQATQLVQQIVTQVR